jgi:hypothetical protein
MTEKLTVSRSDLDHVVRLFESAVEDELGGLQGSPIDIKKVVSEFRNLLEASCEPIPSMEEDQHAQTMKGRIETMQRKAVSVKSALQKRKSEFISEIRMRIDEALQSQRPMIDDLDVDSAVPLSEDTRRRFDALDQTIVDVEAELREVQGLAESRLSACNAFERAAFEFFRSS